MRVPIEGDGSPGTPAMTVVGMAGSCAGESSSPFAATLTVGLFIWVGDLYAVPWTTCGRSSILDLQCTGADCGRSRSGVRTGV